MRALAITLLLSLGSLTVSAFSSQHFHDDNHSHEQVCADGLFGFGCQASVPYEHEDPNHCEESVLENLFEREASKNDKKTPVSFSALASYRVDSAIDVVTDISWTKEIPFAEQNYYQNQKSRAPPLTLV